mgnify:CR=1 FL=1|jgi:hypothetical protein|tara:strand:+ start:63 stop:326 length:264 start_codon:yes stop_codon:yes gene_type:complete
MELWTIVPVVWITTWIMAGYRTYPIIRKLVIDQPGSKLIVDFKYLHMLIYGTLLFIMTPFVWKLAFSDDIRKRWCISYVDAVCRSKT